MKPKLLTINRMVKAFLVSKGFMEVRMKTIKKKSTRKCYECGKEIQGLSGTGYHLVSSKYGLRLLPGMYREDQK